MMFGEYIPFYEYFPQFKRIFPEASNFARGTTVTTFPFRNIRLAPMICYEDIIPSFGRKLMELKPHLMINMTNDAWFGKTSEPYEHLALAIYRSVEHRVELIRAVNTGVSVIIDATGRVVKKTESYDPVITPGVPPSSLLGEVALLEGGHTVYYYLGDWLGYLCLALLLGFIVISWRRSSVKTESPRRRKKQKRR
jgi:apolipoprotein N-acyltransferase